MSLFLDVVDGIRGDRECLARVIKLSPRLLALASASDCFGKCNRGWTFGKLTHRSDRTRVLDVPIHRSLGGTVEAGHHSLVTTILNNHHDGRKLNLSRTIRPKREILGISSLGLSFFTLLTFYFIFFVSSLRLFNNL
jgi:hypothetical protein